MKDKNYKKRVLKGEPISSLKANDQDQLKGGTGSVTVITSIDNCLGLSWCVTKCESDTCGTATQVNCIASENGTCHVTSAYTCDQTNYYCCL